MEQLDKLIPPEKPKAGRIKTMVRRGSPYQQIIQLALEARTDIVIMAVRGRGALNLAVFGSTTYRVIQLGPCPFLRSTFEWQRLVSVNHESNRDFVR
jgi:universal stress protein A